jgi:hypothetical protein
MNAESRIGILPLVSIVRQDAAATLFVNNPGQMNRQGNGIASSHSAGFTDNNE